MLSFDGLIPDLDAELQGLLVQIPPGRVTTYGLLADALGLRTAARWVGEALREHDHKPGCCCHRVVRIDGDVGLFQRDRPLQEKEELLRREGVDVARGIVQSLDDRLFTEFRSSRPLERLVEFQHEVAAGVRSAPCGDVPFAAGFDLSYCRDGSAVGAAAVVETASGNLLWSMTLRRPAGLPYIPTLLTFRELPTLSDLYKETKQRWPALSLCFVDGNGILHPRGAGVASCFGVVADVSTIGIAKSLLCGSLQPAANNEHKERPVTVNGRVVGAALISGRSARPLYVSPAHRIDVDSAVRLTRQFHFNHRLPEPLYWADHLSRLEARRLVAAPAACQSHRENEARAPREQAGSRQSKAGRRNSG